MAFIIDTCVWIDVELGAPGPADVLTLTRSEPIFLSPVTIAELRLGAESAENPGVRQKRVAALRRLEDKPLMPIDRSTGHIFGSLAAMIKGAGRSHRYRVQDLWLASRAIQDGFGFLMRNRRDFEDIPGLDLVVYSLARGRS